MAMTLEVERQVRYNATTDIAARARERARYSWIFLIINVPTEIERIKEKIFQKLRPDEVRRLESGLIVASGGVHYDFFSFTSDIGRIEEPSEIYRSKNFRRDRDLALRDDVGLGNYLHSILEGRR